MKSTTSVDWLVGGSCGVGETQHHATWCPPLQAFLLTLTEEVAFKTKNEQMARFGKGNEKNNSCRMCWN